MILPLDVTSQVKSACGCVDSSIWCSFQLTTSLQHLTHFPVLSLQSIGLVTYCPTSPAPGYKAFQLEGVHGSLQSHGMSCTSTWVQGFSAGRSARFPSESWNVLYQHLGTRLFSWKECTVPSRVMECLVPAPGYKAFQLEGVHGSLQSHGMSCTSTWVQGFSAGRSARFPPESWNVLYQHLGTRLFSWKECTVPSRVMECLVPAPGYKAFQLEGVHGSLQSHGMSCTSTWVQGFSAGRSARFPPESWNVLYQHLGTRLFSWKECTVPSRVMECLGPDVMPPEQDK